MLCVAVAVVNNAVYKYVADAACFVAVDVCWRCVVCMQMLHVLWT